jgi:cell division protease FtsH
MKPIRKRQFAFSGVWILLAIGLFLGVHGWYKRPEPPRVVPYSELMTLVSQQKVREAEVRDTDVLAKLVPDAKGHQDLVIATRLPGVEATGLVDIMKEHGVTFSGVIERENVAEQLLLGWIVPMALLGGIYWFGMRRLRGGPLTFGKSRAKIFDRNEHDGVSFADVAGVDEARGELNEVVSFLKEPERYQALGARIPKGCLLIGPPGTGKTLLARAVAGEAHVPFFSISASEFVEMFVGMGAARVRDLFEQAKGRAPCIVFIDELDAIGKSRGGMGAMGSHDEREQTLNQLLVEMDGFDGGKGVVIMAATNRPEVLDQALVRAGRFDRQVAVDRPDIGGRLAILKVHTRKLPVAPKLELRVVAQRTPGMVGADLANVCNEAALAAARRGSKQVDMHDFEEAIDRIQLGLQKRGRVMTPDEKRRVAYHEAGHALVALSVAKSDPVHRVTIVPRSIGALGATLQLPTAERYMLTKEELKDRICVMMGGRVAEEAACGDVSTGAENDLERATETARQMVVRWGMSERLGVVTYGQGPRSRFLNPMLGGDEERHFSEETARAIDGEVRGFVETELVRARGIVVRRRQELELLAERLLEVETLERGDLERLLGVTQVAAVMELGPEPGVTAH